MILWKGKRRALWETRGAFAFAAVIRKFPLLPLTSILASFVAINLCLFSCIAEAKYRKLRASECLRVGFPIVTVSLPTKAFAHDSLTAREAITAVSNDLKN
jgi:hypothetical protein